MSASHPQHSFSMEIVNEGEQGHNDIMTRRMKNRERQRRYRARKRLEADSTKPSITTKSNLLALMDEQPIVVISNSSAQHSISCFDNSSTRVHSRRDWKKEARRANVLKESEVSTFESPSLGSTTATKLELPIDREMRPNESPDLVNGGNQGTTPGRRDWKAEARKRKT